MRSETPVVCLTLSDLRPASVAVALSLYPSIRGEAWRGFVPFYSSASRAILGACLRNSINIPPTIYLDQGSRIIVFVRRDLDFSAFYPDPVREALQEIRRERTKPDGLH